MNDEKMIFYTPAIRGFQDTGFVTHNFGDNSKVSARVVRDDSSEVGYAIRLMITSPDENMPNTDIVLDRFAALCLADTIIKNLLNQEELVYNECRNANK